jgi:holo-[acyl-carrier protein] synthase
MILGIGIDIVDIRRMQVALERQGGRFIQRVFTREEQTYCKAHRNPVPYYAVRFAAKEALFKALGTGWSRGLTWQDAEVLREGGGAPRLKLAGKALEFSGKMGVGVIHVSLSHSEESAVALVILES